MLTEKKVSVYAKSRTGDLVLKGMRWGLIPVSYRGFLAAWGASTSHARLETVATTPSFENAWRRKRRVIFPMECYFEKADLGLDGAGHTAKAARVAILRSDEQPMGVAGIYDLAELIDGPILSAAMLTREPGERMSRLHHREPVIVEPEDWQSWMDGADDLDLITPWADDAFQVVPGVTYAASQKARRG